MQPRRILVIIVNYRSARLAVECVDSLKVEQSDPGLDLRVVVVENDSGDAEELRRNLSGRPGVSLVVAERNGGFAYGNNVGFRHGYETGFEPDYFHLLNPDTRVYPGAIGELVRFMDGQPRVGITGSSIQNGDGSDWSMAFRFPTVASEIDRGLHVGVVRRLLDPWIVARKMGDQPERVDWLAGASMMVRREVIEEVGGLDEEYFLYFEETDFCWKAARAGWESWYVPKSRVIHHAGQSTGISSRNKRPGRIPAYWFHSRRRFFTKNYGLAYAMLTDVVFLTAFGLGHLKRVLQGRHDPPRYFADTLTHSPLWSDNRELAREQSFVAPRSGG